MQKKWVVLFLIYADFRTKDGMKLNFEMMLELNSLFGDLYNCKFDSKFKINVIINRVKKMVTSDCGATCILDHTFILSVKNRPYKCHNKIENIVPPRVYKNDLAVSENLIDIFNSIKIEDDEKILLITWDHGNGFGVFEQNAETKIIKWNERIQKPQKMHFPHLERLAKDIPEFGELTSSEQFIEDDFYQIENSVFTIKADTISELNFSSKLMNELIEKKGGVSLKIDRDAITGQIMAIAPNNDSKFDLSLEKNFIPNIDAAQHVSVKIDPEPVAEILTNEELAYAIEKSFTKVEILMMMNCIMFNLMTIYAMKKCVGQLIGPQGLISLPGYNYADILRAIRLNPSVNTNELANYCLISTLNKRAFKKTRKINKLLDEPKDIKKWAIFKINMQHSSQNELTIEKFFNVLNELIDFLFEFSQESQVFKQIIKDSRTVCFGFDETNGYFIIDFINWIKIVNLMSTDYIETDDFKIKANKLIKLSREVTKIIEQNNDFIELLALNNICYNETYYHRAENSITLRAPTGISIFFPNKPFKNLNYLIPIIGPLNNPMTAFLQRMKKWLDFVKYSLDL